MNGVFSTPRKNKMNKIIFTVVCFLFLSCLVPYGFIVSASFASEDSIVCTGHPDYPPFMWQYDNTIIGAGPELIRTVFRELNKDFIITYTGPWARVQEMAQNNKVDFLVGAYSNAERRTYMAYLKPYAKDPTSIFMLKGHTFLFNQRDHLIGKKGITLFGDSFGDDLDRFIKEELDVLRVYDSSSLFKQLISKRVDYILWGDYPCQINAAIKGIDDQITKAVPPLVFENMHITISKKSLHVSLVPEMNNIIARLKENGKIKEMLDKYLTLYATSKKISYAGEKIEVILSNSLAYRQEAVNQILQRSKLISNIRQQTAEENIFRTLEQKNTIIYTSKKFLNGNSRFKWISINGDEGFGFHEAYNGSIVALCQLAYESLLNDGTIKSSMGN